MRKFLFKLLGLLCLTASASLPASAQNPSHCATDDLHSAYLESHPAHRAYLETVQEEYQRFLSTQRSAAATYTIPTVVHIIQTSPLQTVSDARVLTQMDVLNEDFRKLNADTASIPSDFQNIAGDSDIEFCLASIDPNGCPTTGINRVVSSLSVHTTSAAAQLKGLIQWDPYKYLNIWVVESINGGGVLGYATFPTSLGGNPNLDGVVIGEEYFGRGEGTPAGAFNLGRTTTHEIGHWLGLFHTFQGGCVGLSPTNCTFQGDQVCDTPPTSGPNYGCPGPQNTCLETVNDLPDQTVNFMDYANDACLLMFSQGQGDRMHFFLNTIRNNLSSASNLSATGCDGTTSPGCAPTAAFSANIQSVCVGDTVFFQDESIGLPTSWNWTFQGGSPATSTDENPMVVFNSPGNYEVMLEVNNSFGSADVTETNYINVAASSLPPLVEGFENNPLYPDDWYGVDGDGGGTWILSSSAASSGSNSLYVVNFGANYNGTADDLVTAPIDMSSLGMAELTFDRAYRRFNSFTRDTLQVQVSPDCGRTWTTEWQADGLALATVGGLQVTSAFVPTASQWQQDTVDLSSYLGSPNVRIRFRCIGGGGQDLYLDNVNIDGIVSAAGAVDQIADFAVVSPFVNEIDVRYRLTSGSEIEFVLRDVSGRTVYQVNEGKKGRGMHASLLQSGSIESLPGGIYFLTARAEGRIVTRKLIKIQ